MVIGGQTLFDFLGCSISSVNQPASEASQTAATQMLMKMNRIWGNKERLIPQALQRLSADRLQKAITVVSGLDQQSKGLQIRKGAGPILEKLPGDPWDGLRMLGRLFV